MFYDFPYDKKTWQGGRDLGLVRTERTKDGGTIKQLSTILCFLCALGGLALTAAVCRIGAAQVVAGAVANQSTGVRARSVYYLPAEGQLVKSVALSPNGDLVASGGIRS